MKCQEVQNLLHPYSDGELDLVRHLKIEKHLADCAECAEQEKHLRSLRAVLSSPSLYHSAPTGLRARIQLSIPSVTRRRRRLPVRLIATAAGILLLIGASATMGILMSQGATSTNERLMDRVVVAHVRSLQADHLKDVASSDKHTVKPWLQKLLDFSPQVPDLSRQDYTLTGGRLDYLTDRPVAALVYSRRSHVINVFTWPAVNDEEQAVRAFSRQGFHVRHWQRSGMTYWTISDLNDQELDEFVKLFQEHS
jgi:anti-sigma factor RsiW